MPRTATFRLQAGETVKCTFTNRQRAKITVLKKDDADPANTLQGAEFQLKAGALPRRARRGHVHDRRRREVLDHERRARHVHAPRVAGARRAPRARLDQQVTVGAGDDVTLTFVDPRLHKVIVLVGHEGTNTLAASDVTGGVTGTTLAAGATLPDGVSEADLCGLGGATRSGLGHVDVDATVDVGSDAHTP